LFGARISRVFCISVFQSTFCQERRLLHDFTFVVYGGNILSDRRTANSGLSRLSPGVLQTERNADSFNGAYLKRHGVILSHPVTHRSVTRGQSAVPAHQSFLFRRRLPAVQSSPGGRPGMVVVVVVGSQAARPAEGAGPAAQRGLVGRRRRAYRRLAPPVVAPAAQQAAEDAPEALAEDAVDDEVGRTVDDDEQVAEVRGVDERIGAVLVLRLADRFEDGQHAVRRVAQYHDHDDDDDDVRYVLLLRPARRNRQHSTGNWKFLT